MRNNTPSGDEQKRGGHCTECGDWYPAEDVESVLEYISKHDPVDQNCIVEEFGNRGLKALRELMSQNRVTYNIDWKLTPDARGRTHVEC